MRFSYSTDLPHSEPASVFDWHERPGALERLTPPWGEVEVLHREGGIRDGGVVSLRVHRGPTSFRWDLRHRDYEHARQFRDEQTAGPLRSWVHTHRFSALPGGGTRVDDEIDVEPPLGAAGASIGPTFLKRELGRLFRFRYRRLFTDLARHAEFADRPRLTVAISGASGLVGRNLTHFLTTGGHRVIPLVRDSRRARDGAVRASRVQGTELLARTLASMKAGPRVLVSMSAVGYYGDRGQTTLDETAAPGSGFLAEVCRDWEGATRAAERAGVRVVLLRGGVALSPAGGAIGQMLLPFKMGVGGRLGSGRQYMSWIDLDDLVALIVHALYTESLAGPVNATSPHPVTNATFTTALGRALGRPTVVPVPALAVKALFGQLGTEALLWGQRVLPLKATKSGFSFFYEGVEESLRFQLGREDQRED